MIRSILLSALPVFTWIGPAVAIDAQVSAIRGNPYSIVTIEIPVPVPIINQAYPPLRVEATAERVLFPYSEDVRIEASPPSDRRVPAAGSGRLLRRIRNLVREIASDGPPATEVVARRVTFLTPAAESIAVRVFDQDQDFGIYDITLIEEPAAASAALATWWSGFVAGAKQQIDEADYPPKVEQYLVAMLSGRLDLPLPDWYLQPEAESDDLLQPLKLIAGTDAIAESVFRRAAAGIGDRSAANLPVPAPPAWVEVPPPPAVEVEIESMATRVPPECFYLRYGSFENYIWFRDLSNEYGGDLSRMVTLSGTGNESADRIESQLNLKTNELSRLLGPQVIEDQAIIGTDLFIADGASLGILFRSKNAFALRTSLRRDRSALASSNDDVTLEDVRVGGQGVSLLSSPDNRVRSYLVEDGEFFFVTNSRTLARRFVEVGESGESLAATPSFRFARKLMPTSRGDTVFAYFSPEMLRGVVSPDYLIELRRRLRSQADIALVRLATAAAREIDPSASIDNRDDAATKPGIDALVDAGFLPTGFGERADRSGLIRVGDQVLDTLRGARGTFTPIADIEIDAVTPDESAWYQAIAAEYSSRFPDLDPIMVGVQRQPVDPNSNIERLTIHAEIAPFDAAKYGKYARYLGPPTEVAMRTAPDDIALIQAHVAADALGPPTHLFAAVKDSVPPDPDDFDGILNIYRASREIPAYLGAWPQPGTLDRLPLGLGRGTPVAPGMSRLIGGLYRYSDGAFGILSFYPEIITAALPFLEASPSPGQAQVRLRIGSLARSQLKSWVNQQLYERSALASEAGANFLSILSRQLGVEPGDAPEVVAGILGESLQDPLGGSYQYDPASRRWISTAWRSSTPSPTAPPDYLTPILTWFRGVAAALTQYDDRVVIDATLDIQRAP